MKKPRQLLSPLRSLMRFAAYQFLLAALVSVLATARPIEAQKMADQRITLRVNDSSPNAQTLSGTVSDETGKPLPGVNVTEKGTTNGTATNSQGTYKLSVEGPSSIVVFSYVGYIVQEVSVKNSSTLNVSLKPDVKALSEVVVTALGVKKEAKRIGYATATVKPEQITENRTPNFMNSLVGKIAGVNISPMATGAAGTSKIRIRGQSSFSGQNNPLIVLNGVPIDNSNFGSDNNGNRIGSNSDGGDGLGSINPDDIETMTILKGGAAAALYGSRAKDGVIMVTTKSRGTNNGIGVEYNLNYMSDTPLDFTDFQYDYGQGENGVRPTTPNPTSGVWSFGEKFQPGMTQVLFDGVTVPYEPVRNRVRKFYRVGNTVTNTIKISTGGENGGMSLSLGNMDSRNIVPNSTFSRRTINLGFTQNIGKKLNVSGNINYSNEYNNNPAQINGQDFVTVQTIYTLSTSMPFDLLNAKRYDANGNEAVFSRFRNRTNPYISVYDHFERIRRDRIFGNITARYNFTDWLYLQGRIGQDFYSRSQDYNIPTGLAYLTPAPAGFVNGRFSQEARRFRELNADFLLGANRRLGNFNFDLSVGGNKRYVRSELNNVIVQDFVVRGIYTVMNGRVKDPLYDLSEKEINSLYGAAEVSFKDFLYINATARNDWFSTLSPANRSILYPSVTGSFVFSQAFTGLPTWLTFGKLRAGYSRVGSDLDVAPYSNSLYFNVNNNLFPNQAGESQPVAGISSSQIPNANLRPMSVSEAEVGLELKLFQNRIGLDLTYYNKVTSDQILAAQISDASGFTSQLINVGKSKNSGFEMLLTGSPVQTANFRWDVSLNGSYNTSEVLSLGIPSIKEISVGGGSNNQLKQVVGKPIGQLYVYGYLRDAQGRQVFDSKSGKPLRTSNQINVGSAIPKWLGGITNTFNYKGISLSFLIDFKLGHKMISATNFNAYRHGLSKETLPGRDVGYVIGNGVNELGEVNTVKTAVQTYYETVNTTGIREQFVYNAGFWKFRQLTIGYDFTKYLPKSFFIKGARLSAVANNIALLKKWVPNIDPEASGLTSDNNIGLEATSLPTTRSIGFNLNIKF